MIDVMAGASLDRKRDRVRWARRPGPRPGPSRLTDAEIVALRQALAEQHRQGLALLARSPLAEIIGGEDRGAGSDDETEQTV
jgi:hypothetical protein